MQSQQAAYPEKSADEISLEQVISVLDQAFMSTDPRIQECLRRLMVTVALIEPKRDSDFRMAGPLRRLFDTVRDLQNRVNVLENYSQRYHPSVSDAGRLPQDYWTNATAKDQWTNNPGGDDEYLKEQILKQINGHGK
jgi:hypothetical protein